MKRNYLFKLMCVSAIRLGAMVTQSGLLPNNFSFC